MFKFVFNLYEYLYIITTEIRDRINFVLDEHAIFYFTRSTFRCVYTNNLISNK